MRVALLSSIESFAGDERTLRAFARIGGRTVLQRQLDFALLMGCEQVACLSDALHPELIDLQHTAEDANIRFQVIRDIKPLSGLVKAADEVLVVSDGLVFDEHLAKEQLAGGKAILSLSADSAIPEGFERLDRDHAWAGMMLLHGGLVEKLADFPSDIDPQSALLRLALQSGAKIAPLSDELLVDQSWGIARNSDALNGFETRWLSTAAEPASFLAPVSAGADRVSLAVLKRHTRPEKAARAIGGLGYALIGVGLLCGYFGYAIAGFFVAAIAAFAARFSATTSAIFSAERKASTANQILSNLPSIILDTSLVTLVLFSTVRTGQVTALFATVMLVGLLRLAALPNGFSIPQKLRDMIEDRGILAILLGVALIFGQLIPTIQIVAGLLLVSLLYQTYSARITRA